VARGPELEKPMNSNGKRTERVNYTNQGNVKSERGWINYKLCKKLEKLHVDKLLCFAGGVMDS